jgi:Hsp20/alpha crystallin family
MAVLARWVSPWSRFSELQPETEPPMPEGVNTDAIQAQYRDGVLQVVIPGAAQVSPVRKVPVQVASEAAGGATKTIDADTSSKAQAPSKPKGSPEAETPQERGWRHRRRLSPSFLPWVAGARGT